MLGLVKPKIDSYLFLHRGIGSERVLDGAERILVVVSRLGAVLGRRERIEVHERGGRVKLVRRLEEVLLAFGT